MKGILNKHINSKHSDEPKLKVPCYVCGKLVQCLKVHIQNKHEKLEKYECEKCDEKFFELIKLKSHKVNTHGEAHPYQCDVCGSGFYFLNRLKNHISKAHDKVKERNINCEICNRTFLHLSALKTHMFHVHEGKKRKTYEYTVHEGKREYKCQYCDKKFDLPKPFRKHIYFSHKNEPSFQSE